jgi:hypothetical protein
LDMLEFVLSNYAVVFKKLSPFEQVLRHQVCSLLMTSLPTSGELDPEVGEPGFRRLVLRSVATVTRLYVSIVPTECEVFNLTGSSRQQKLYAHFLLFVVTGV